MPNQTPASLLRWLFCCAICLTTLQGYGQERPPKTIVKVELWVFEVDFTKLHSLDLTGEELHRDGKTYSYKLTDVLEGKASDALILQRPEDLLKLLRQAGVVHNLANPTIGTVSGRKASLAVGGLKFDTKPIAKDDGSIEVECRVEINEPVSPIDGAAGGGNRHRMMDYTITSKSGRVELLNPPTMAQALTSGPNDMPVIIALTRATVEAPASSLPVVESANAKYIEIR